MNELNNNLSMTTTKVFHQNNAAWLDKSKRRALNEGGTAATKTYSILQLLILIAVKAKKELLISVVSESLPHLKRGCIRTFKNIMGDHYDERRFNKTEFIYDFGRAKLEFFAADMPAKQRGARRDILFINEANNVTYDTFRELDIRTRIFTFMDWNPVGEFWAHEHGLINSVENCFIHSTYKDGLQVIPPEVIVNIESNKERDPNWWNIYGLGRLGRIEGLVYPYFEQVNELPKGDVFYGLDFGFASDPVAVVKCVIRDDCLFTQELIYETGLTNNDLAHRMIEVGIRKHYDEIFADSAEPKSIEEIYRHGFNIKGCPKGAGSVEYGHQKVNQFKQNWTKDSLNGIKEQRNFRYIQDKNGKLTEKTSHMFSHLIDARRYAIVGYLTQDEPGQILVYSDRIDISAF